MKYFTEKDKIIKSFAIDEQEIMAADSLFESLEALRDHILNGKKKWLDTALRFPYSAITRITLFDSDNCIQLLVAQDGKTEKVPLEFGSRADYTWLLQLLETKTTLTPLPSRLPGNNGFAKIKNYLIVPAVAVFSIALAGIAYEQEQGKTISVSGGKRGVKRLFIYLADTLGFYGSIALGIVVTLAVLLYMIRQNKKLSQGTAA